MCYVNANVASTRVARHLRRDVGTVRYPLLILMEQSSRLTSGTEGSLHDYPVKA
jgi:hypothetical protein